MKVRKIAPSTFAFAIVSAHLEEEPVLWLDVKVNPPGSSGAGIIDVRAPAAGGLVQRKLEIDAAFTRRIRSDLYLKETRTLEVRIVDDIGPTGCHPNSNLFAALASRVSLMPADNAKVPTKS